MSHEEALSRCVELNRGEPGGHHWFVRERAGGTWEVATAKFSGLRRVLPLMASVSPRPVRADPRPSVFRSAPPWGAGA